MMEQRDIGFPLELRNEERLTEERVMTMLLAPYGEVSMLTPYSEGERFVKGAFRKAVAEFRGRKIPLLLFRAHAHERAVGRALNLSETPEGPVAEFRIAKTAAGNEVIEEYREGLLGAVSVGFRSIIDRIGKDRVREVVEASLLEASVVPIGAYDGAKVLSYREPAKVPDLSEYLPPPRPSIDLSRPWGRRA